MSWAIETNAVMISPDMLRLVFPDGESVSIHEWNANSEDESLNSDMPCSYDNDHVMVCDWDGTVTTTAQRSETDLTPFLDQLPITVTLKSKHCSVIHGCVEGELGELRLH